MDATKRILQYIKGTTNLRLMFPRKDAGQKVGYVDANWARDLDRRRSTIGLLFNLGCNSIVCSSKLQPTMALSMMKVEYKVLVDGAKEVV
jgi:hypothetical protein